MGTDERDRVTPSEAFHRYHCLHYGAIITSTLTVSRMINPIEGPRGWIAGAFIGVGFGFLYARGVPPALAFVINKYRKRKAEPDPVRPRFGTLRRRDGDEIPLVFYPTENPDAFRGFHAGTEEIVVARPGDELSVDVLGPSQSVELAIDPSG